MGFFDKIAKSEVFVILDTVQFEKNYFQNRNKVRDDRGNEYWVTVPVTYKMGQKIKDVKIAPEWKKQRNSYLDKIEKCYSNRYSFKWWYPKFKTIIEKETIYISELNTNLIKFMLDEFSIDPNIILASEMGLPEIKGGTNVVEMICKAIGTTEYISGVGGKNYLDLEQMKPVKVTFNDPQYPHYSALEFL
jgi:hypothetical protein